MSYHNSSSSYSPPATSQRQAAPPGYHYMPDGSLMLDSQMVVPPSTPPATPLPVVTTTTPTTLPSLDARSYTGGTKSVVLTAKLNNNKVLIEQTAVYVGSGVSVVEVLITPQRNYKIEPEDLSVGYLPPTIRGIVFEKNNDSVIAIVKVNGNQLKNNEQNVINLPISVIVKATHHNVRLVEKFSTNYRVITKFASSFPTKKDGKSIVYSVKNTLGKNVLVFTRTFVITNGNKFTGTPSFVIDKNKERFSVITKKTKNSVEFKVYYTSPSVFMEDEEVEQITFITNSHSIITPALGEIVNTSGGLYGNPASTMDSNAVVTSTYSQEDSNSQLYSFDPGPKIGPMGGVRILRIKGVPGTPFKMLLQDSNFKTYNFKTRKYEVGGGMFEGKIPNARRGFSYGEYMLSVVVPRSVEAVSYSERLIKDTPIDHTKITSVALANFETTGKADILTEVKIAPASTIKLSFDTTGGFTTNFKDVSFGPGDLGSTISGSIFKFTIKSALGNSMALTRQPIQNIDKEFTAWVSGDKTTFLSAGSSGTRIENDWSNTRVVAGSTESSSIELKIKFSTLSDGRSLSGSVSVGSVTFGEGDNTYNLKLLNFLTQTSL